MDNDLLEKLLQSKKYRDVCPDTVRRIWQDCQKRYKKPKDAERAAREALHGITGAFMTPQEAVQLAHDMLAWHISKTDISLEKMLNCHASTRERLPVADMDALYQRIFATTGRPRSVLDLACGINPLYLGARGIPAVGVDISGAAVGAVNRFAEDCDMPVSARCADLLVSGSIPGERFDLALTLKLLPLLERQKAGAAMDLMRGVNAAFLVVSFPTRSLSGRNVGMAANYAQWLQAHLPPNRAIADSFETANELFYVLREQLITTPN